MNQESRSFEDELSTLKADVAIMRSNYAMKADLQQVVVEFKEAIHATRAEAKEDIRRLEVKIEQMRTELHKALLAQTWKLYGLAVVLVTAVHFVTRAGY